MSTLTNAPSGSGGGQRQSQVSEQFEYLDKACDCLSNKIDVMVNRLDPALKHPDTIEVEASKTANPENLVPIADMIRKFRFRIDNGVDRIDDILNRLEI